MSLTQYSQTFQPLKGSLGLGIVVASLARAHGQTIGSGPRVFENVQPELIADPIADQDIQCKGDCPKLGQSSQ